MLKYSVSDAVPLDVPPEALQVKTQSLSIYASGIFRISLYYLVYLKNKKNGGNKVMIKKLILMNFKAGG